MGRARKRFFLKQNHSLQNIFLIVREQIVWTEQRPAASHLAIAVLPRTCREIPVSAVRNCNCVCLGIHDTTIN